MCHITPLLRCEASGNDRSDSTELAEVQAIYCLATFVTSLRDKDS
jgi:hypothetical protein